MRGTGIVSSVERRVRGLTVTPFSLPDGCLGAYYPEMNPLIPLSLHDDHSKTPAAKSVPVRIRVWTHKVVDVSEGL